MSASERLKALDLGPGHVDDAEFITLGYQGLLKLRDAHTQLLALVEAAEAAVKIDATSSYQSIYSAPTEMASPLRNSLAALEAVLS